jgi:DnaJ-class molecular chaperone
MATSSTRSFYDVLGVPKTASDKEIRAAYRRLARKHHPDLNPGDKAAEARFKEIQGAYDVLSDPEKRKKYDQYGPRWEEVERMQQAGFGGGFNPGTNGNAPPFEFTDANDFSDIFEGLFGGLGGLGGRNRTTFKARPRPGTDLEYAVEVSLEEAYHGAVRVVDLAVAEGGRRRLEVKIPPGVKSGARIRLAGEGNQGSGGGKPGDLYLNVTVRGHGVYDRKDDDLYSDLNVPLYTAILGGEVMVPTIKGSRVALKIPAETQNGRNFRLTGLGMPRSSGGTGDLIARVKVSLPAKLTPRERELFEELHRIRPE